MSFPIVLAPPLLIVVPDRALDPYREAEKSRDGSAMNLSAVARNQERADADSKLYIDERRRLIVCSFRMARILEAKYGSETPVRWPAPPLTDRRHVPCGLSPSVWRRLPEWKRLRLYARATTDWTPIVF